MGNRTDFPPKKFSSIENNVTTILNVVLYARKPATSGKGEEPSRHNKFVAIHKHTQDTLLYSSLKDIKFVYTLVEYGHLLNCAVS